jgi:hypothetical protein
METKSMYIDKIRATLSGDGRQGLVLAALGALYLSVGYAGWLGSRWTAEHHDRAALLFILGGWRWLD